jgi:hypothetical protein
VGRGMGKKKPLLIREGLNSIRVKGFNSYVSPSFFPQSLVIIIVDKFEQVENIAIL